MRKESGGAKFGEIGLARREKFQGCERVAPVLRQSPLKSLHRDHMIFAHTIQTPQQFRLVQQPRLQLPKSQADAERLGDLRKALGLARMGVTPCGPAIQFVQDFRASLHVGLHRKFVPEVFDQLKAFKFAKVFNGLQGLFHAKKSSISSLKWVKLASLRIQAMALLASKFFFNIQEAFSADHQGIPQPR